MNKPITKAELDALELLEKAATPAPWEAARGTVHLTFDKEGNVFPPDTTKTHGFQYGGPVAVVQDNGTSNDLDFIPESRNALPRLIADHRRLVELLEEQHATCGRCQRATGYTIPYTPTTPCEAAEYLRQWEGST